jgi:hypothetical protein
MPGPIRKPLAHPARGTMITPAAVELFAKAKRLLRRPETKERDRALNDLTAQLEIELKLKPWMPAIFDVYGYSKPEPYEDSENWWQIAEIVDALEAVLRERRKAERAARRVQQSRPPRCRRRGRSRERGEYEDH